MANAKSASAPARKRAGAGAAAKAADQGSHEGADPAKKADDVCKEPTAYDLIVRWWNEMPSATGTKENLEQGLAKIPELPARSRELWEWLNRPCYRPFPWSYIPDPVAFVWGVSILIFIAPIAAIEIIVSVPTLELLKAEWAQPRCAWLRRTIPELVRSVSRPLGKKMLKDPRDHSYLPWMFILGVLVPMLFAWVVHRHVTYGFEFSTMCIYHLLRVGPRFQLFAHAHPMVHKEGHSHTGLFKAPFKCMNVFAEWWIGPFYGVVPWNYYMAHMKIHHRWHNDVDDVHTNLDFDRTDPRSFLLYMPRFTLYWTGVSPALLFIKRKEWALLEKLVRGMVAYYGLTLILLWWNPVFCVVYWIFPHAEAIVLLCAISYLWHAFVEEADPGNQYVNSVTILDGHDNIWNEDFHVVHHHAPNTHWTDAPAHFEAHKELYAAVNATIFQDTEEGKLLQWLFEGNWDMMAKHYVDLNGKMTVEEKKALIIRRLKVVVGAGGRDGKRKEWGSTESIRDFKD